MVSKGLLLLLFPMSLMWGGSSFSPCDVNQDGNSDVLDIQRMVNEALGAATPSHDLNQDHVVNVIDAQVVINAVLLKGCLGQPVPTVTDFNPKTGPAGTLVSLTGTLLVSSGGAPVDVRMSAQGGGVISAPASAVTATSLTFVVPPGATSGPIKLFGSGVSGTSSANFTVTPGTSFTLSSNPPSTSVMVGQTTTVTVNLTSNNGFSQLAQLGVSGVPAGVSATFKPPQTTVGQQAVLTVAVPSNQPTGSSNLIVTATATIDGLPVSLNTTVGLNIVPVTTSFVGRTVISDGQETSLGNVKVAMLGTDGSGHATPCSGSTFSDASGNFTLSNLPAGCVGPQLVSFDGTTVTSPAGKYAGINIVYTLTLGQVTASPVLVHLPRIDTAETFMVQQNSGAMQSYSYSTIPGLSLIVYPGTTFTMPDGSKPNPFPLAAVYVPVDRLPDLKPPVPTMINIFIVAFQPANVTANQPVAVYYPNPLKTAPGTSMPLLTLDPTKGSMVPYGTGIVSADALTIIPDFDPGSSGHRYGIVHFDWHGPMPPPPPGIPLGGGGHWGGTESDPLVYEHVHSPTADPAAPSSASVGAGPQPKKGGSIDVASGVESYTTTDMAVNGNLGRISVDRTYVALRQDNGPFGGGTYHGFSMKLDTAQLQFAAVVNLVMPDGSQFPFTRQADGTFTCISVPSMIGAVMQTGASGSITLRLKVGTVYTFTAAGALGALLASSTDLDGNTTTIQRDSVDPVKITSVTEPGGRSLTFTYDDLDRITDIADPIGRHVTYAYNPSGYLAQVTNPAGGTTKYTYDAQGRLQTVTDPRNVVTHQNQYDVNGRVVQQTLADGSTLQFAYTLANPLVATSPVLSTTVTDQLGRQTVYRFNSQGYVINVTDPLGQNRTFNRDPQSNRILSISGPGVCDVCGDSGVGTSSFTYDANGNMSTETDALGGTYTYSYDQNNLLTSVTDPLGNTVSYTYNAANSVASVTDQNGNTSTNTYWPNGLLKSATDPGGATYSYNYDTQGNITDETDPLGNVTHFRYDAVSRPVSTADPLGNVLTVVWDNLDQVTSATSGKQSSSAEDRTLSFGYDSIGGLLSLTDNAHHSLQFQYDSMERLTKRTDALGRMITMSYSPTGRLMNVTGRDGKSQSFHYDGLDRPDVETYPDATVTRTYDGFGRPKSVTDSQSGTFSFAYDIAGELIQELTPFGGIAFTRDPMGRVKTRQVTGQPVQTLNYDAAGNLLSASTPQASVSFAYDHRNLPQQLNRSNNVNTMFSFDTMGQLTGMLTKNGATPLNTQSFQYDGSHRLLAVTNDIAQPLITQSATGAYDAGNQISSFGGTTYTHDSNGNRLTETSGAGGRTYTWDGRGRLTKIVTSDGRTIDLIYDPAGNLLSSHQTGNGTDVTRTWVLDENTDVVYQGSTDQTQQFSILTGGDVDSTLAIIDSAGNAHFSIGGLVSSNIANSGSSGAIDGKAFYEPYGQTTVQGAAFPVGFTGRWMIDTNLYYLRTRYYDAIAGRFLSEDTADFVGGANLYEYAGNDPVDYSDPTGRYAGVDDATLFITGALAKAGWEIATEMMHIPSQPINWKHVMAAALGGGVGALLSEYGTPVIGSMVGSAVENAVDQMSDRLDGTQCGGFNLGNFVISTVQGGFGQFGKSGVAAMWTGKKAVGTKIGAWLDKVADKLQAKLPISNAKLKKGGKALEKLTKKLPTGGSGCK